jgi:L-asparaginase II
MSVEQVRVYPQCEVVATVSRGAAEGAHACVESWHYGAVVVVKGSNVVFSAGDPTQQVFPRSALKPMQAVSLFLHGLVEKYAVSQRELAVMVGSHNGTKMHVEAVRALLYRGGLQEAQLLCGAQPPGDKQTRVDLAKQGALPERIHHNCSGKHAGFLLLAQHLGADVASYLEAEGMAQACVREVLSVFFQCEPSELTPYLDGCGAPTYRVSLLQLAHAMRLFSTPHTLEPAYASACEKVVLAMCQEPVFVAGRGRFCTALLEAGAGKLVVKNGAEGVYVVGLVGSDTALAVKVADGNERAYMPVVVDLLLKLGVWESCPPSLLGYMQPVVYNTQKTPVGSVQCVLDVPCLC